LLLAGNERGLVPKVKLVFLCRKNIADTRDEMEGDFYEKYCDTSY
jgi:hypothetical protein